MKLLLIILLFFPPALARAQQPEQPNIRFIAVDIFVDTKDKPLGAYQLEFKGTSGDVKIVGIEGGEHAAFADAPFYDPKAMQHEHVILASFSTGANLPRGKSRVATIHVQVGGATEARFELKLQVAADARGKVLPAQASFEQRKPQ